MKIKGKKRASDSMVLIPGTMPKISPIMTPAIIQNHIVTLPKFCNA